MPSPARLAALAAAFLSSGCSCGPPPPEPSGSSALHLLARRPDALIEQPGVIAPVGDLPGTATWGVSEGPGWARKVLTLPEGLPYRETNQPEARLILPATRPADRDL